MSLIALRVTSLLAGALALSSFTLPVAMAASSSSKVNVNAQADLRRLAVNEETYLTDNNHYASFAQLAQDPVFKFHLARGITLRIVHVDSDVSYCLEATTSTKHYMYDSASGGGYTGTRCKGTTTGRSGGVVRGPAEVG
jgi:hypothetical protein